jgi:hypothetical protein
MPFPVEGLENPCCWGIWCEVSGEDYATINDLWNDPDQCAHPPFPATLANDLHGYPPTAGLAGSVRFLDPDKIPFFQLAADVVHPIADEMREGVTPARVLEWLAPYLHDDDDDDDDSWPFDQAPDVAAITTLFVIEAGLPILRVIHYSDDHSWAFLCGTTGATEDGRVISMKEAIRRDPTLREVADLPPGWVASRDGVGGNWRRDRDPSM